MIKLLTIGDERANKRALKFAKRRIGEFKKTRKRNQSLIWDIPQRLFKSKTDFPNFKYECLKMFALDLSISQFIMAEEIAVNARGADPASSIPIMEGIFIFLFQKLILLYDRF